MFSKMQNIASLLILQHQVSALLLEICAGSIKYVLKWNGFDIGVELEPGDIRFKGTDHERKLKNGYGHFRGYVGEDGEALDTYLHPDLLKDEPVGTDLVFEVNQLQPEDGVKREEWKTDEYKYMIGYDSQESAEAAYLSEMPSKFFGGSKKVTLKYLEQFKKKAATV